MAVAERTEGVGAMTVLASSRIAGACCQASAGASSSSHFATAISTNVTPCSSRIWNGAASVSLKQHSDEAHWTPHAFPRPVHSLSRSRRDRDVSSNGEWRMSAVGSPHGTVEMQEDVATPSSKNQQPSLQVTYLENNSFIWEVAGVTFLVDPVLVGKLDFGIPVLYNAGKKYLKEFTLGDLPPLDALLITQGYDDHCHKKTLDPLSKLFPDLKVIATPNAESILKEFYPQATYLEPGDSTVLKWPNGTEVKIRASPGPVLGPPWQRPENGYFLEVQNPKFSLYYEPHCISDRSILQNEQVDVIVTPVVKQVLPAYTLVSGMEDAVELVKILKPRYVVSMKNGDLDAKGLLALVVKETGSLDDFKDLLEKDNLSVEVLEPQPGIPLPVL